MTAISTYAINPAHKISETLSRDPNILFALMFGSYAAGRQKKGSDLDIGIYFEKPLEGLALLHLISTLSDLAGRDVDVVVLNKASAFLRHQVMKHRITLFIKDSVVYTKFREKTISDYDEYKYISGINSYDR